MGNFFGGLPIKVQREALKAADKCPHIIVGTPGRVKALADEGTLDLSRVRHFVVDECDKVRRWGFGCSVRRVNWGYYPRV